MIARRTFCAGAGCGLLALGVGCSSDAPAADDAGGGDDGGAADLTSGPGCGSAAPLNAGAASAIAVNSAKHFTDNVNYDLFVCRDAGGLFTVDATCTHAGCEVRFSAAVKQFRCPCHGASFDFQGQNPQAPAFTPLANYAVCVDASGNVLVDYNTMVSPTTRV